MLRDPLAVKKLLLTTCGQKYLQNPKNLEPLDHICVCECVCVWKWLWKWVCWRTTLWCCDVEVSEKNTSFKKTHISLSHYLSLTFSLTLLLSLGLSYSPKYQDAICWPRKNSFLVFWLLSFVSISSHFWCQLLRSITILPLLLRKNRATSL